MGRQNTRRHPRYDVQDVEGTFLYNLQADVINLSTAGMALETLKPLDIGRCYMFAIHKDKDLIRLSGKVVWCVLHRTERISDIEIKPIYHSGVHFEDVLTNKARDLLQMIEESALLDVNRRIFGRFKPGKEPGEETKVFINSEMEFMVEKISLCGLLIETSLRVEVDDVFPMEINLFEKRVSFTGRIAWVSPPVKGGETAPVVNLGVEFMEMSPEGRADLEKFITLEVWESEFKDDDDSATD